MTRRASSGLDSSYTASISTTSTVSPTAVGSLISMTVTADEGVGVTGLVDSGEIFTVCGISIAGDTTVGTITYATSFDRTRQVGSRDHAVPADNYSQEPSSCLGRRGDDRSGIHAERGKDSQVHVSVRADICGRDEGDHPDSRRWHAATTIRRDVRPRRRKARRRGDASDGARQWQSLGDARPSVGQQNPNTNEEITCDEPSQDTD